MKKAIFTMLVLASVLACSEPKTETQKPMAIVAQTPTIGYIEMTSFKLNKGVAEADFLAVTKQMQTDFLSAQTGFVKRTMCVSADGVWTDIVSWTDQNSHENAMKIAETSEKVMPFMSKIDFASVKMNLAKPVFEK
jgi:hypothetical protein